MGEEASKITILKMKQEIKLEKFEGPLDLLLQLIELEKVNISEVALSDVTEQFLNFLDKMGEERSDELADFLVIATKLVYLKSKNLLPYLYPEEDEGPSLADQLKMYQQYVEASKKINILWEQNRVAYGRVEPPVKQAGFVLPANAQITDLQRSIEYLVIRLRPVNPLPQVNIDHSISVKQRVESIFNLLKTHKQMSFGNLLSSVSNKTDVIVSFLALLELMREAKAAVKQGDAFGELEVSLV
ncbi:MAG: Segregation and condensation protein A [Candidatus Magasanikbacteria bacterium GW2011_GWA2_37_8]|uniref:Segregation and condensation protein A n=1 Tax=Candidatus Magasanikbacteria bacterium GW2011_GWA2_37_8 TaxID=1619036 RepID=A0A0G0KJQ2_9BACT|nr:MAG: Segregation and condensation protein A [Candidatus Magasanikbacteria bacterium GW2011_GWA2_37_8]